MERERDNEVQLFCKVVTKMPDHKKQLNKKVNDNMKEKKKIFNKKHRVSGLNVPMVSENSSKGTSRSEIDAPKVVIRQWDKICCPEILKKERLSVITTNNIHGVKMAITSCSRVEEITGVEKFKKLRDQGAEWTTYIVKLIVGINKDSKPHDKITKE